MKTPLPPRQLPDHPNLKQLRRQAKELLDRFLSHQDAAVAEVNRFYRRADPNTFALHDAQLVLARSYGYDSWPKLKASVKGVSMTRLVDAVRAGDLEQVRAILRARPELASRYTPEYQGLTSLHFAVMARRPEMVRFLVRAGADPYTGTAGIYELRDGSSPFAMATDRGYEEIVKIIREEEKRRESGRPAVDQVTVSLLRALNTSDENSAIHILEQHPELVRFRTPSERFTLLHLASAHLMKRTATWLLDHGVDTNARSKDGSTPLDVAGAERSAGDRADGLTPIIKLLRQRGAEMTVRSAVMLGDQAFLQKKAAGQDLITPRDDRGSLLRLAVDYDRPEILKWLLDLGLDPNERAGVQEEDRVVPSWGVPLYECARHGKHAMAEMLLERGADPNGKVYAGGTPLSEAYGQRDEKMIALLERYGGTSNASMAGLYRRVDLARRLLDESSDKALPDDGFSKGPVADQLLFAAARGGDPEILSMAMARVKIPEGDPRWNNLLQAPLFFWNHWTGPWCHPEWDRTTYLKCFKMILAKCGPPNAPLNCGATILHQIVAMGDHVKPEERMAFATVALDAGARLDLRDDLLKSTPLGWACRWGREDLVRLFLDRAADQVEKDAEPWATPREWAKRKGHAAILELLEEYKS